MSAAARLLGNKIIFAWLWEVVDGLPADDQTLIRRHVSCTLPLTAEVLDRAVAEQAKLVAKPADGSAGHGVLLGPELSSTDWADGVRAAVEQGGAILQEYLPTDRVPMDFVQVETGETVTADVPYSLAPYLFGRHASGGLDRVGYPGCDGVLNLAHGVLLTGVLLKD
ncbi:hypothetical protein ABGB10_30855 [Micromonospora sp. B9E7]